MRSNHICLFNHIINNCVIKTFKQMWYNIFEETICEKSFKLITLQLQYSRGVCVVILCDISLDCKQTSYELMANHMLNWVQHQYSTQLSSLTQSTVEFNRFNSIEWYLVKHLVSNGNHGFKTELQESHRRADHKKPTDRHQRRPLLGAVLVRERD